MLTIKTNSIIPAEIANAQFNNLKEPSITSRIKKSAGQVFTSVSTGFKNRLPCLTNRVSVEPLAIPPLATTPSGSTVTNGSSRRRDRRESTLGNIVGAVGEVAEATGIGVVTDAVEFSKAVKTGKPAKAGILFTKVSGGALSTTNAIMCANGNAVTAGAFITGAVLGTVGFAALTLYELHRGSVHFKFHEDFANCIKNQGAPGVLIFLKEHLTLTQKEQASKKKDKILKKKKSNFRERTGKDILEKSLEMLNKHESSEEPSTEELRELGEEIEAKSFENGVRASVRTALYGINTLGAGLSVPSHGISLFTTAGLTFIYLIANRNDDIVLKVTEICREHTETGRKGAKIFEETSTSILKPNGPIDIDSNEEEKADVEFLITVEGNRSALNPQEISHIFSFVDKIRSNPDNDLRKIYPI